MTLEQPASSVSRARFLRRASAAAAAVSAGALFPTVGSIAVQASTARTTVGTDLNGQILTLSTIEAEPIYWVDFGRLRHIPGPDTAARLFGNNWLQYVKEWDVSLIAGGSPISNGALLAAGAGTNPRIFFVDPDYQTKRAIDNHTAFLKYHFSTDHVERVDGYLLQAIPTGQTISTSS